LSDINGGSGQVVECGVVSCT